MEIIGKVFFDLPRQGPGSNASTSRALKTFSGLSANPRILDVGCGGGMQTVHLARESGGQVTAVDISEPLLERLQQRASREGFAGNIETLCCSMDAMPFPENTFDLIWSEGAIYNMGLAEGLANWQRFLKPGGYIAVTEISWLTEDRPEEAFSFWQAAYPKIAGISENIEKIESVNLLPVGYFPLPVSDWWDEFYHPMERRCQELLAEYTAASESRDFLEGELREIALFREYSDNYGYVFYLMQKPSA